MEKNIKNKNWIVEEYYTTKDSVNHYFLNEGLIRSYSVNQCKEILLKTFPFINNVFDYSMWVNRSITYWFADLFDGNNIYNELTPKFCILMQPTTSAKKLNNMVFNLCGWIPYVASFRYVDKFGVSYHYDCPYNDGLFIGDEFNAINPYPDINNDIVFVRQLFEKQQITEIIIGYIAKFSNEVNIADAYLYHVTSIDNIDKIKKNGLCPKHRSNSLTDRIYFATNIERFETLVSDSNSDMLCLLRVDRRNLKDTFWLDEKHMFSVYYFGNVKPEDIEVAIGKDDYTNIIDVNMNSIKTINELRQIGYLMPFK